MKITSSFFTMTGAALGFAFLTACGGGGMQEPDDSPEGQAFLYRDSLMHLFAAKMALIGGMAREEIPLDEEKFVKATADLAALAGMNLEGFETEGIAPGSRALPAIWENFDDFRQKNGDLVDATQALADAAAEGGFDQAQGLVQGTAGTCGGCHRTYRERME